MTKISRTSTSSSFLVALFASAPLFAAPPCEIHRPDTAQPFPCGVIAVGSSSAIVAAIGRSAGASVKFEFARQNAAALTVPGKAALDTLRHSSLRFYPDRPVAADVMPEAKGGKPGGGGSAVQVTPEGIARVGGPGSTASVGVAIIDTGIDLLNQDLVIGGSFDAYGGSGQDQNGHGTHVSGIVAAKNNSIDVVGVVPGTTVHAVRVLDASGSGSDSDVIAGLNWVFANMGVGAKNIQVANMSLGREGTVDDQPVMRAVVKQLVDAGVAVVVSAGNNASREISQMVPASYPEVIAVASTTAVAGTNQCSRISSPIGKDTASYFTTDGRGVVVSAPGATRENVNKPCMISSEGILSLKPGGGTTRMSGTSMAAPHVTGIVAAIKTAKVSITVPEIKTCLGSNAEGVGTAPLDSPTSGYTFDQVHEGVAHLGSC